MESGTSCDAMESGTDSSSESGAISMVGERRGEPERERRGERGERDEALRATDRRV
jgi:hypothetical protein